MTSFASQRKPADFGWVGHIRVYGVGFEQMHGTTWYRLQGWAWGRYRGDGVGMGAMFIPIRVSQKNSR